MDSGAGPGAGPDTATGAGAGADGGVAISQAGMSAMRGLLLSCFARFTGCSLLVLMKVTFGAQEASTLESRLF